MAKHIETFHPMNLASFGDNLSIDWYIILLLILSLCSISLKWMQALAWEAYLNRVFLMFPHKKVWFVEYGYKWDYISQ